MNDLYATRKRVSCREGKHSNTDKYYLCDVAYSHMRGFMCPYRNIRYWFGDYRRVPPTTKEEKFNQAHTHLRNVIERAFGVLKARFAILNKMPPYTFEAQRDIAIPCMSIHNFLRHNALGDWLFKQYENDAFEMNAGYVNDEAEREENAPHLSGREDQVCMNTLCDDIDNLL